MSVLKIWDGTQYVTVGGAPSTQQPSFAGSPPLASVVYKSFLTDGLLTNTYDLYTVPVGRRTLIHGVTAYLNQTNGGAVNAGAILMVKTNGLYYPLHTPMTWPSGISATASIGFMADVGETFAIYLSNVLSTMSISLRMVEFDTSVNVRSAKLYSLTSGNNTLFTSSNTSSVITCPQASVVDGNQPVTMYVNGASGSVTIGVYLVPSGQVVNQKYTIASSASVATMTRSTFSGNFCMSSGSYLSVFCSSAASPQLVWTTILEV